MLDSRILIYTSLIVIINKSFGKKILMKTRQEKNDFGDYRLTIKPTGMPLTDKLTGMPLHLHGKVRHKFIVPEFSVHSPANPSFLPSKKQLSLRTKNSVRELCIVA